LITSGVQPAFFGSSNIIRLFDSWTETQHNHRSQE